MRDPPKLVDAGGPGKLLARERNRTTIAIDGASDTIVGMISLPLLSVDASPLALTRDARDELALVGAHAVDADPVLARVVRRGVPVDRYTLAEVELGGTGRGRRARGARLERRRVQIDPVLRLVERGDVVRDTADVGE